MYGWLLVCPRTFFVVVDITWRDFQGQLEGFTWSNGQVVSHYILCHSENELLANRIGIESQQKMKHGGSIVIIITAPAGYLIHCQLTPPKYEIIAFR
jgi:hypothetical protein